MVRSGLRSQQGPRACAASDVCGPGPEAIPGDGLVQDETHGLRRPRVPHAEPHGGAGRSDRPHLSLTSPGTGTSQSHRGPGGGWSRGKDESLEEGLGALPCSPTNRGTVQPAEDGLVPTDPRPALPGKEGRRLPRLRLHVPVLEGSGFLGNLWVCAEFF